MTLNSILKVCLKTNILHQLYAKLLNSNYFNNLKFIATSNFISSLMDLGLGQLQPSVGIFALSNDPMINIKILS